MKRKLRIFSLCIALIMLMQPLMALAAVEEEDDGLLTWEEVQEIGRLESPAVNAYNSLLVYFRDDSILESYIPWYAGCYISENYNLVIKRVYEDENLSSGILKNIENPEIVVFEDADISLFNLLELFDSVNNYLDNIVCTSIDVEENRVEVSISVADAVSLVYNRDPIIINPYIHVSATNDQMTSQATTYKPGGLIVNSGYTLTGSLGLYGTYRFDYGATTPCFVTAGHVTDLFKTNYQSMYFGSQMVFSAADYYNSSKCLINYGNRAVGDYSFLAYNTSVISPTTSLYSSSNSSLKYTDYFGSDYDYGLVIWNKYYAEEKVMALAGQSIYIEKTEGTTGYKRATISAAYAQGSYDRGSIIIEGLVLVKSSPSNIPFSNLGDSGAPTFYLTYKNGKQEVILFGIISGGTEVKPSVSEYNSLITPMPELVIQGFEPYL